MSGLTQRQSACLDFIRQQIATRGIPPSFQEIADGLGLHSKSGVHRLVKALAERGHITYVPDRARTIQLGPDFRERLLWLATAVVAGDPDVRRMAAYAVEKWATT